MSAPLRMRSTAATALGTSLLLALVGISLAVSEHTQTRARLDQRLALQADGEASAVAGLFTRTRLALRLLAAEPTFRDGISATAPASPDAIDRALGALERAAPHLVGAASAIGLDGRERARVVRGEATPAAALAHDVRDARFFRATLATRAGEVHVSQPYRSSDTGQWVVSNSILVRDDDGAPLGVVRFELPLADVRATATAALAHGQDIQVAIVDRVNGREILDTTRGLLAGGAVGGPVYRGIGDSRSPRGALSANGRRLAFRTLTGVPAGLGWVVVAGVPQPSPLAAAGLSPGVLSLLALALALAVAGTISLRRRHRDEARVLSEAEGGRAEAERRSRTDALTGLYNRRHVLEAVTAELARCARTGVPPSVLMLDLDHFQRINAAYGHSAGDRVLSEVAARLQGRLRGYDVLGRWGGDEFIVLAPGVPDDATLRSLAEQIRRLIGTLPFAAGEALLPVTVSIGAVRASEALRSAEGLIDCAGRALSAAKRHGRNRVQLFADLTVEDLVAEEPEPLRLARALALAGGARSGLPGVDAERVSDLAAAIARHLLADEAVVQRCRLGGLLHDIGTVAVGDRILALVGPPTARDRMEYEAHTGAGERLVRSVAGVSEAAVVVAAHEESFDGSGYPAGLSGDEIPLEARVVAGAIAFVRLAAVLGADGAASEFERAAGSTLDPEVVTAALQLHSDAARHLRDVPAG